MSYSIEREMTAGSFIQPTDLQNQALKTTPYGFNKRQLQFHFLSCLKGFPSLIFILFSPLQV